MATNDFIGFASNGSANIMSQADYAAAAEQGDGVQPGMASSKLVNKIWRQGANMAAAIGRIAAARGYDALDNGDLDVLQSSVDDAISIGTFNRIYFSQISGNYTAPRTGVYRITLKGGGGGGGGAITTGQRGGSGGGEGAINISYVTMTKNTTYAYTIGAGGAAGTSGSTNTGTTSGSSGGTTSITIGADTYAAWGGSGGFASHTAGRGGLGAAVSSSSQYGIPGANGTGAVFGDYLDRRAPGGGNRGGIGTEVPLYGGGGTGASPTVAAQTGADGFILIEYAG